MSTRRRPPIGTWRRLSRGLSDHARIVGWVLRSGRQPSWRRPSSLEMQPPWWPFRLRSPNGAQAEWRSRGAIPHGAAADLGGHRSTGRTRGILGRRSRYRRPPLRPCHPRIHPRDGHAALRPSRAGPAHFRPRRRTGRIAPARRRPSPAMRGLLPPWASLLVCGAAAAAARYGVQGVVGLGLLVEALRGVALGSASRLRDRGAWMACAANAAWAWALGSVAGGGVLEVRLPVPPDAGLPALLVLAVGAAAASFWALRSAGPRDFAMQIAPMGVKCREQRRR